MKEHQCIANGCGAHVVGKELCAEHYEKAYGKPCCAANGCEEPVHKDSFCEEHYRQVVAWSGRRSAVLEHA